MQRQKFDPHSLGSVGALLMDTAAKLAIYNSKPPRERHHKKPAQAPKPKPEPRRHWYSAKRGILRGKLPKNYWRDVARQSNWQNTRWMRDGSRPGDAAKYAEMKR